MRELAALVVVLLVGATPVTAAEVAEIIALRGTALLSDGTRLAVGSRVAAGAVIQTQSPGRVKLRFADGSVVVIGDRSTFKIEEMQLAPNGRRLGGSFVLDVGLISQTVAPGGGPWKVKTPTAVTAVRGTEFFVEVKSNRATEVSVRSGAVSVEPLPPPANLRMRSLGAAESQPIVLDRSSAGTRCEALTYLCSEAKEVGGDRLKALDQRLSGV